MNYKELNITLSNLRTKKLEIDRLQKKVINLGEALGYKSPTYEEKVQTSSGVANKTEDEQYALLQVMEFTPYNDVPMTPVKVCEGTQAKQVAYFLK